MNKSSFISAILDNYDLVEYLQDRGFSPARSQGHRLAYYCPIHGPEKSPSFYVFLHKDYPYYHCFGCKAHGDVIDLVAEFDNCSLKEAIGKLAQGVDISQNDLLERIADDIDEERSSQDSVENLIAKLSLTCRGYLNATDFDEEEVSFMDAVFQKIDYLGHAMDLESLQRLYDEITEKGLPRRWKYFQDREEKRYQLKYET